MENGAVPLIDEEDADVIKSAINLLPAEPWSEDTWKEWANAVKAETGRKGRGLFMPLRKAATGRASGPEMTKLLPLIGRKTLLDQLT